MMNSRALTASPSLAIAQPQTVASLGALQPLPRETLVQNLLPRLAVNGDLHRFSKVNREARLTALQYSFGVVDRHRAVAMRAFYTRTAPETPSVDDMRELSACNALLAAVAGHEQPLVVGDLYAWEDHEAEHIPRNDDALGSHDLVEVRDVSDKIVWAARRRDANLDLSYDALANLPRAIGKLTWLLGLDLSYNDLFDASELRPLRNIVSLTVRCNTDLEGLDGIENMSKLRTLDAARTSIDSIEVFRDHPALEELDITYTSVRDLTPLLSVSTLRKLRVPEALQLPPGLARPGLIIEQE